MKTNLWITDKQIRSQLAMTLLDMRCLYKVYSFFGEESRKHRFNEREAARLAASHMAFLNQMGWRPK